VPDRISAGHREQGPGVGVDQDLGRPRVVSTDFGRQPTQRGELGIGIESRLDVADQDVEVIDGGAAGGNVWHVEKHSCITEPSGAIMVVRCSTEGVQAR
jgi:hypothetical protein